MDTGDEAREGRWQGALDGLEAQVERVAAAEGDAEGPPTPTWRPPPDLGPIPATLRPRAEDLLERLGQVCDLLARRRDRVADDVRELGTRRRAGAAYRATDAPGAWPAAR